MKRIKKRTIFIILVFIIWLLVIFSFSAMDSNSSSSLTELTLKGVHILRERYTFIDSLFIKLTENHSIFYIVRKMAHMFVFCMLEIITFFLLKRFKVSTFKASIYSILMVILYACTDEFHQLFVPGRSGQIKDVFIDTIGGSIGLFISLILLSIKNLFKSIYKKIQG